MFEIKKNHILVAIILIIVLVVALIINGINRQNKEKRELEQTLVSLGSEIYKNGYYDMLKDNIIDYEKDGIKLTLYDMFHIIGLNSEDYFYNESINKECDNTDTYVIIYPKYPYNKDSYEIKFNLECGY